jgi:hypothetical protein
MKTTSHNQKVQSSAPVQHSHTATKAAQTKTPAQPVTTTATPARVDTRLPIDHDARALNRKLDTAAIIGLLRDTRPDLYERATIVGTWIWLSFDTAPEPTTRQQIAQLGFHWNHTRQVWQHPCGHFTFGSKSDPRDTYTAKPAMEAFA